MFEGVCTSYSQFDVTFRGAFPHGQANALCWTLYYHRQRKVKVALGSIVDHMGFETVLSNNIAATPANAAVEFIKRRRTETYDGAS